MSDADNVLCILRSQMILQYRFPGIKNAFLVLLKPVVSKLGLYSL